MTCTTPAGQISTMSKAQRRRNKKKLKKKSKSSSVAKIQNTKDVPTVVFIDPDSKAIAEGDPNKDSTKKMSDDCDDSPDLDLKKTKFEIIKFGFNSMKGLAKEDAETAFAVSLGARPPKKPFLNYKDLQEVNKKEKEKKAEEDASRVKQPRYTLKKGDRSKNRAKTQTTTATKKRQPNTNAAASSKKFSKGAHDSGKSKRVSKNKK